MSVVTATLTSEGVQMDPSWQLLTLEVQRQINRIPRAELVLSDGDGTKGEFEISNSPFFAPGRQIGIQLRYEGSPDHDIFQGLVVGHGVEVRAGSSLLRICLKDAAVKLTGGRRSTVYRDRTDSDVIGSLIDEGGLTRGRIDATSQTLPELVRYDCTAWDFILTRAEINSRVVIVEDSSVSVRELEVTGAARHRFEWGIDEIYDFDMEADGNHGFADTESVGWDLEKLEPTQPSKAQDFQLAQGDLDPGGVARDLGFEEQVLRDLVPVASEELEAWATSRTARSRMAWLRGRLAVPGMGELALFDVIEVAGISGRFDGKTLISGLRHSLDDLGWRTDVQFGLPPELDFAHDVAARPAAGLVPPAPGLQIGLVDEYRDDPDDELRVRVVLPSMGDEPGVVWARLATPNAGQDRGYFFRPEPGDEVVLGFLNDDPRFPVILGSLFGSKNAPPEVFSKLDAENEPKGIVTKKGTIFAFLDEDKASVYVETPKGNKLLLDDDGETVSLTDQHGNSLKLHKDGVDIESMKDLKIKAHGTVEIDGRLVEAK